MRFLLQYVGFGVAVTAPEGANPVMGGASGGVGRPADDCGNLRVRQAGHMVVSDGLSLLGRERTERRPQTVIRGFPGIGCGPGLRNADNRYSPAALGTKKVNRLVVGDRD